MRVAYLGPSPRTGGGVAGVAALLLEQLVSMNHEIDCYVSQLETSLPEALREQPGFILIDGGSRFRYGAWYSRTELTKLVSGQVMRAMTERRLAKGLASRHRIHPYDLVYQFSHVEVFNLAGAGAPPLIVHPETHAAGELRWFDIERPLAQQCEPAYRRTAARAILSSRAAVQRRHARLPAGFVCPSRAFQRTFCADYEVDPGLTRVVPNPIDLRSFRPRHDHTAVPRPVRVLFVEPHVRPKRSRGGRRAVAAARGSCRSRRA